MNPRKEEFQQVVDLDKAINNSSNVLLKKLPRYVKGKMKRILRQKELNEIHNKYINHVGIDYVNALLTEFEIKVNIFSNNDFSKINRCIFVANHPLGGIDALAFLHCIDKLKGDVVSPSNAYLRYIENLHPLIVGVNVFGKNTREQVEDVLKVFESEKQIMIFPAGTVSRKINGEIQDIPWQKTFINKAIQTKRCVIPVFISGSNSKKFYRIAKFRKYLGIKMSIETLYLPQEMLKKKGSHVDFIFGEPIYYSLFDNSKSKEEWAGFVRNKVYEIGSNFHKQNETLQT